MRWDVKVIFYQPQQRHQLGFPALEPERDCVFCVYLLKSTQAPRPVSFHMFALHQDNRVVAELMKYGLVFLKRAPLGHVKTRCDTTSPHRVKEGPVTVNIGSFSLQGFPISTTFVNASFCDLFSFSLKRVYREHDR